MSVEEEKKREQSVQNKQDNEPSKAEGQNEANGGGSPFSLTYSDLVKAFTPMNAEARKREEQREARERAIAGMGDALSAIAGLYTTVKGAPPVKQPSISERYRKQAEQLRRDRDRQNQSYLNLYLRNQALQQRQQQAEAETAYKNRLAEANEEEKKSRADKNKAIGEAQSEALAARARKDDAAADKYETEIKYLNEGWPLEQAKKQAEIEAKKRQAENAQASADEHRRRGTSSWVGSSSSGSGGGKPYGTFLGRTYSTKADYDKAVTDYAKANGIKTTYWKHTKDGLTGKINAVETARPISVIAGESERHYRARQTAKPKQATAKPAQPAQKKKGFASGLKF